MDDEEAFDHGLHVGRSTAMCEVIQIIETGMQQGFTESEIIEAIQSAAGQVVEEYADFVDEMDETGWVQ